MIRIVMLHVEITCRQGKMHARSRVFDHGEPLRLRWRSGNIQTMQGKSVHRRLPDNEKDAKRMNRMLNLHLA